MRYRVAAIQYEPKFAQKEENLRRLTELVVQAAQGGARLVVLPEMAATGYAFRDRAEIAPLVEPVPGGGTVSHFERLAAAYGIWVVVGLAEVDSATGAFYNTAALIGPEGYVGKYRKTHLYHADTKWSVDGDMGVPVFATPLGRIALLICMDADYIEPARLAALGRADLIAFPTNWEGERTTWHARALENGLYFIAANRWGEERGTRYCGHSMIIDPRGERLAEQATDDGVLIAEVDLDMARAARSLQIAVRRPKVYHDLLLSKYLWSGEEVYHLPAGRPVTVAAGQAVSVERIANQARWADRQARDRGWPHLDLAVFPSGPVGHEGVGPLTEVAGSLGCYITWAGPSAEGGVSAFVVGPDGLTGQYHQVHTTGTALPGEVPYLAVDLPWGRVALLTGSDLVVPEAGRIAALSGADLLIAPADLPGRQDRILWRSRWLENDTPVVVANRAGGSIIFGGSTATAAPDGESGMVLSLLDTSSVAVRRKELLRKRQPRWYLPLVKE